jgi:hypothetical protein
VYNELQSRLKFKDEENEGWLHFRYLRR